ncbi:MAG: hypothetical protein HY000_08020, partial [Planctomycetes bacterium]|nr:hypothetical protein [Planctomycetota bacterium]
MALLLGVRGDRRIALGATIVFYLLVGLSVAVAVFLADDGRKAKDSPFRVGTAVLFWPLYLPILLAGRSPERCESAEPGAPPRDEMAAVIAQVEAELDAALSSLDGWAEHVLAHERERIRELRHAWRAQAARIREMDRLLVSPLEFAGDRTAGSAEPPAWSAD